MFPRVKTLDPSFTMVPELPAKEPMVVPVVTAVMSNVEEALFSVRSEDAGMLPLPVRASFPPEMVVAPA